MNIWKDYPFLVLAGILLLLIIFFADMQENMLKSTQNIFFIAFMGIIIVYAYLWDKRAREESGLLKKKRRKKAK
ncbi:MAG: hypothetical protein KAV48_05445 [Methanomicrobia archaeon]|jgi:preprotein translocase subunit SecG|nr:hypothetical protein [Methanomicrobia archaeon]MCK4310656.1 hypothetical protein [Methanomicrobia archaeon]MCK4433361.1 hypothetical protein [Methanomicrobia archaeon]MCK4636463.1 hypothetical protein [Methanomicrobia archaeon]